MSPSNSHDCSHHLTLSPASPTRHLADRVRAYFEQHPEVSREQLLLDAVGREVAFQESVSGGTFGPAAALGYAYLRSSRPRLTEEDVR